MKTARILFVLFLALMMCVAVACGDDDDDDDNDNDDATPDDDDTGDDDTVIDDDDDDDDDDTPVPPSFQVGAARVDISPSWSVKLGGYGLVFISEDWCRWSDGIQDPIYATALAFDDGEHEPVILINLDTVGIITTDVVVIQQLIADELGVGPERVIVVASHNHASPDTIGIWGVLLPPITGRDEDFMNLLISGAYEAGVAAYENRRPAVAAVAKGQEPRFHFNSQDMVDPLAALDSTMTVLSFTEPGGEPIATLMNWGCHPMVMPPDNTKISSDFVGPYYHFMDEEVGGVNMFVNGNLGAAVHPYYTLEDRILEGKADTIMMGRGLADTAQLLLGETVEVTDTELRLKTHIVLGQLWNPFFVLFGQMDLIPRDIPGFGQYGETTMSAFWLGDIPFATVPGELVPNLGFECKDIMGGDYPIMANIGQDWLGYIMTAKQYLNPLNIYFSILSVGPNVGDSLLEVYREVYGAPRK